MRCIAGELDVAVVAGIVADDGDVGSVSRSHQDLINLDRVRIAEPAECPIHCVLGLDAFWILIERQKKMGREYVFLVLRDRRRVQPLLSQKEDVPEATLGVQSCQIPRLEMNKKDIYRPSHRGLASGH